MVAKRTCKYCARYFKDTHNLCFLAETELVDGDSSACNDFEQYYEPDAEEDISFSTSSRYDDSSLLHDIGMSMKDFL